MKSSHTALLERCELCAFFKGNHRYDSTLVAHGGHISSFRLGADLALLGVLRRKEEGSVRAKRGAVRGISLSTKKL